MKSKIAAITLLASTTLFGYSNTSFAETCYEASGSVTTENVSSTLQIGNINLTLSDSGSPIFSETGFLVGNITGTEGVGVTVLSHTAKFPQGNSFVTNGDIAAITGFRAFLEDGTPCSFYVLETISNIERGTRFFRNVTSSNVVADGYISYCPGDNENHFELSGTVCVE